ncbi:MAG: T9SS type A sorting domain-containing protein [Bacteroidales bacterium]|nr:T9SS type A sorting domain-containing protein [Bacteroidales bacterium]
MKIFFKNQEGPSLKLFNSAKMLITGVIFMLVSMFAGAATYYVSTTGKDTNNGTQESPWSITHAFSTAAAGDIVNIKGGNYGHLHLVVAKSGISGSPITFQAQAGTGTPTLNGVDWLEKGISASGKSYITLKGLRVKNYRYGIYFSNGSHHTTFDGCVADSCCNTDYVYNGWDGTGITLQNSNYGTIINCSTIDNGGYNIHMDHVNYCTLQNCTAKCKQTANNKFMTDYYIIVSWSSNNTIEDCLAEDINGSFKGNHGIIFKDTQSDTGTHSANNLVTGCISKKFEECFGFAHGAHNNTVENCNADNTGKNSSFNFCLQARDGASYNTFRNVKAIGKSGCGVASAYDGSETWGQTQTGNTFENCSFTGVGSTGMAVFLRNAVSTTIKNCNIVNVGALFRFSKSNAGSDLNSGTVLRNCILSGITNQYETSNRTAAWANNLSSETGYSDMGNVATSYTDFYAGFTALTGTGNVSSNPLFASTTDFHLQSQYGRWNGTTWVTDNATSPCINTGSTSDSYANEPVETGGAGRIDMGMYGNTAEASKKYPTGNQTPLAVIDNITPSPATQGSAVSFTGTGTDADGTIAAYEWSSSINGIFNTLQDPSYSGLSVGTHTISFRVQDNSGSWSTYATRTLVVNAAVSYPDLVGYWPLDESTGATAYDSTSCANNGTIYGATHVAGKKNMGLNFTTATTNDVEIPSSASLNAITSAITLSAWVNADTNTANSNIIERWIYGTGIYQRAYTLYVGTNGTISFGLSNDGTSTNAKWITTTETISRNQWTHIAATFDGTTMKIYINGTFSKSLVPGFSTIFVPTGNVHIGNWQTTATTWENPFKGSLDEVRLYKKALSASEIFGLYNNPANLVADLKFNENAGTIATDNSGNVNTGTLTNSPTWTTGKIGSALNFTNNYVNLPSSTSLNTITSAITLSTWIKASANTANSTIIGRWLYGTGVNQRSFILYVGSTGTLSFGLSNDGTSTNAKWLTTTATITRDVWTYVTATFDGTTMKIYINGSLSTSDVTGFSTIFVPTGNVQIGKWQTTATTWELPFIGAIDEVKVYNKALSLSEIQALYGLTRSAVFVDDSQDKPVNKPSISTKCYPNPFSSEITISYNVPEEGKVRIDIYNSIGQLVSKVVDENLTAGEYSTVWNIESSNAGELANGLYICKLIINGKATASKIMLVK